MTDPTRVAVVGATGYAGYELARLLLRHPHIEKPTFFLRESHAHVRCLTELFPQLRGWGDAPCKTLSVEAVAESGAEVVFLSTPHEASLELVPQLLAANPALAIVDLSGAFRFRQPETFAKWYKLPPPDAKILAESSLWPAGALCGCAAEGSRGRQSRMLSDLRDPGPQAADRRLAGSTRQRGIVCDCKSGATGAGKEPKREMQFVEVNENFRAYGLFTHRHTPEVSDHLGLASKDFVFTTHLLPVERGILSTLYVWLDPARKLGRNGSALPPVLCRPADGAGVAGGKPAGAAARGAHEFLRHRVRARSFGRAADHRFMPRQSWERRGGASGTKSERDARVSGNGGIAMRMVVKIAGALLERDEDVHSLARQITELARAGHEILVVHGGGKIFTATLARMGIESRFVNGLRVTDRETRDAAIMVFGGLLNKKLAGAISLAGQPAVGISASDAACFLAEPMQVEELEGGLGFVGYLTEVNVDFLRSLWREGIVPVASCMGLGADGELYNINADHMAAAAAEFIDADRLIFMTDVAGVLDGEKVLQAVRGTEIEDLIRRQQSLWRHDPEAGSRKRALGGRRVRSAHRGRHEAAGAACRRQTGKRAPGTRVTPGDSARQRAEREGRARSGAIAMAEEDAESRARGAKRSRRRRSCADEARYLMNTYRRPPMVFTRGSGCRLYDSHGTRISRFSGRHRRECAGLCASADGARDPARSGPRDAHLESLSQSVSGTAGAQARGVVGPRPRVFLATAGPEADRGRAEAGAAYAHAKARQADGAEDAHSRDREFVSRAHVRRAFDHAYREISRAVRAAGSGRRICALERCRRSRSEIRRYGLRDRDRADSGRGRHLPGERSLLERARANSPRTTTPR